MQCFYEEKWTAFNYWHFTLHLHIFSGGKAKINLHTTPKLTVVMPINCLLRSIHFSVRKMMRSPLAHVLVFLPLRCMFSVEPRNKIISWTYWLLPGLSNIFFAIRLCFLQSFNKDSTISFCWRSFLFLSKPFWQMMLFVTNVNEWRHIRWRNYPTHSNEHPCKAFSVVTM